jgi:hypothetical protein
MGENFDKLSDTIKRHLRQIIKTSGLPEGDDSLELLAQGWLEKEQAFDDQVLERRMEIVESVPRDEEQGFLLMTYSGSLLTFGPLQGEGRMAEYTSIGLRQDVPETAEEEVAVLAEDVNLDDVVKFEKGPVKQSSPVFKIAMAPEEMDAEEQMELLSDVTQVLTEDFLEVNKTTVGAPGEDLFPEDAPEDDAPEDDATAEDASAEDA